MTDNEFERTARAWLDDGPNQISDRAVQSALDQIHVTRQRRSWGPARRFSSMGNPVRLVAGLAAVVLASVIGLSLLPGGGFTGGFGPPPPTPTPLPTPIPSPLTVGDLSPMAAGAYVTGDPFLARVTFTLPGGWEGNMGGPYFVDLGQVSGPTAVTLGIFDTVYADPCDYNKGPIAPRPGSSVDELANALAALPNLTVTTPTDITIDGFHGKQLTMTAPSSLAGCSLSPDGDMRIWDYPLGATFGMSAGDRVRVWILDVDGQRLVIESTEPTGQTAVTKSEVQGVLDSIHLAPATTPTPSPS